MRSIPRAVWSMPDEAITLSVLVTRPTMSSAAAGRRTSALSKTSDELLASATTAPPVTPQHPEPR